MRVGSLVRVQMTQPWYWDGEARVGDEGIVTNGPYEPGEEDPFWDVTVHRTGEVICLSESELEEMWAD